MISQTAIDYATLLLKQGQGFRDKSYKDEKGNWTIGYGHKLLPQQIGKLNYVSQAQALQIFRNDTAIAVQRTKNSWGQDLNKMNAQRTAVILDMTFTLGGFKWPKLAAAISQRNWQKAAYEIMDSDYAKQVKARAKRNSQIMRDGKMHTKSQFQ